MRNISVNEITKNIKEMCIEANHFLSNDMKKAINNAYEKVFEADSKIIDTIIGMSLADMVKLQNGDVDMLSTFAEPIQTELRILIAYFFNLSAGV